MAPVEDAEKIKASLDVFIDNNTQSPASSLLANDDGPLVILYGQTKSGVPRNHPKIREIEAGQKEPAEFKECEGLLRGTLRNRVLFETTIHNSNVSNCILISCTIYGGTIETSYLRDCLIRKKDLGVEDTSPTTPFISGCRIENGAAYDAKILDSTLKGVDPIQGCDINDSLAILSAGSYSTLTSYGIHESQLHDCEVIGGVLTESVTQSKTGLSLRRLPVEIRKAIYSDVTETEGLATGLIAALRPDYLLYGEVLETFFQKHTFVLSKDSQEALKATSTMNLQRITKIALRGINPLPTSDVSIHFPTDMRITDIRMDFQGSGVNTHDFYNVTKLWFKYFGTIRKFTVVWSQFWQPGAYRIIPVAPEPPKSLEGAVRVANKRLETEAVLVKGKGQVKEQDLPVFSGQTTFNILGTTKDQELQMVTWTWVAEEGSVLAWDSS